MDENQNPGSPQSAPNPGGDDQGQVSMPSPADNVPATPMPPVEPSVGSDAGMSSPAPTFGSEPAVGQMPVSEGSDQASMPSQAEPAASEPAVSSAPSAEPASPFGAPPVEPSSPDVSAGSAESGETPNPSDPVSGVN